MNFEKTLSRPDDIRLNIFIAGSVIVFFGLAFLNNSYMETYQYILALFSIIFIVNGAKIFMVYEMERDYKKDLNSIYEQEMFEDEFLKKWGVLEHFPSAYTEVRSYFRNQIDDNGQDRISKIGFYEIEQPLHLLKSFEIDGSATILLSDFGTIGYPFKELQEFLYFLKFKMGMNFGDCFVVSNELILEK